VCCIPEGNEDAVYVMVNRTIGGQTKRYIERMASRSLFEIESATFMDSFLTYDGRNTTGTTMTLTSASSSWTVNDEITITASAGYFVAGDPGNSIVLHRVINGVAYEVQIELREYTSSTVMTGYAVKDVPVQLRAVALGGWDKAVDSVGGLSHLEGKAVSVFADGNVVANPNNAKYPRVTVSGGAVTLERTFTVIHVGLPYVSDFETLDLDMQGEQVRDKEKNVKNISLLVHESRGIFAGAYFPEDDTTGHLEELRPEQYEGDTGPSKSGLFEIGIESTWGKSGRFVVRQSDPLPLTILAAVPSGEIGG
jgi:hypothetical protein